MIISGLPVSFRRELLLAVHNFEEDTFRIALYTASAVLTPAATTHYTPSGEVVADGYSAGGVALTGRTVSVDGQKAVVGFNDVQVPGDGMFVEAALVYNASKGNRAVRIIHLGAGHRAVTNPTLRMPSATDTTAIIRI